MRSVWALLVGAVVAGVVVETRADTIAYDNTPSDPSALQDYGHMLGLDFNVNSPITVTQLGVFDNGDVNFLNGVAGGGTEVGIYDLTTQSFVGAPLSFTSASPGTQVNGDAFKLLANPINLPAGFHGTIAAYNVMNYNSSGASNTTSTQDSGGGAIAFAGTGRNNGNNSFSFPSGTDGGPTNRYDAGTFQFAATSSSIPHIALNESSNSLNKASTGNQSGYTLGETFNVNSPTGITLTNLAVYDSGADGLSGTLHVRIYDSTGTLVPGTAEDFTNLNSTLAPDSTFRFLDPGIFQSIHLAPGSYRLVADGFTASDPEYNVNFNGYGGPTVDGGGGAISFPDQNSYAVPDNGQANQYPNSIDPGLANLYAIGSFSYSVPEPACAALLGVGSLGLLIRRHRGI